MVIKYVNPENDTTCANTEFAVEVHNNERWVRQLDVFGSYEEAKRFMESYNEPLNREEYLAIIYIDYDENEVEIRRGYMCDGLKEVWA